MKRPQQSMPLESTIDMPVLVSPKFRWKLWGFLMLEIVLFGAGFLACRLTWPRYVKIEKILSVSLPQKPPIQDSSTMTDRANAKLLELLQKPWLGVMEIQDNEAQTVWRKRASIGNKQGFTNLHNGISYRVHSYFTYRDTGYGIVDDGEENLFLVIWKPGITKAPDANPGNFRIPHGRRIENGGG